MFFKQCDYNCREIRTFALAISRRAAFIECWSGYREGALHIEMRR